MQVVATALEILEEVAAQQPVGVSEVARNLDLPKTTVQRALKTLAAAGWIRADENEPTRWVLTTKLLATARYTGASTGLRDAAMPVMERLREQTQETIHLAVLEGDRMVVVERLDSPMILRSSYPLGYSAAVHATSTGKAYLSRLDASKVDVLLPDTLSMETKATIKAKDVLMHELTEVRRLGYACNRGELREEIGSIAAAICDSNGRPAAALSISAPIYRISADAWAFLGRLVADAASDIRLH